MRAGDLEQLERIALQYASRERFLSELTLDPPSATSDLSDGASLDEDWLVLSTVHSAKGQEWDRVHVLNVSDGSFPNEYATGSAAQIEEERRLLYVAMTRARDALDLVSPLKYYVTQQPRAGDTHVYGAKSRFMTDKVHKTLDAVTFHSTTLAAAQVPAGGERAGYGGRERAAARYVVRPARASPHIAQPRAHVHRNRRARLPQGLRARQRGAVEGDRIEGLVHLLGHEAAAPAVHVRIAGARLLREVELQRRDERQLVLRAREGHVQQAPLLLDELRPCRWRTRTGSCHRPR